MADVLDEVTYSNENTHDLQRWINELKTRKTENKTLKQFQNYLKDGGAWLVELYKKEYLMAISPVSM